MTSSAKFLRDKGWDDLSGRWGEAALLTFVYTIIYALFSGTVTAGTDLVAPGLGTALSLFLLPMGWGFSVSFLDNHKKTSNDPFHIGCLFDGYRDFSRVFLTLLLQVVYIILWSLLLIVPGIIKALSYSMTPFILRDYPTLKYNGAIELSMDMMNGHKWDLLWLYFSFIGWGLLCLLPLGIGYFWLSPYVRSSVANFYEEVKKEYEGAATFNYSAKEESTYSKEER